MFSQTSKNKPLKFPSASNTQNYIVPFSLIASLNFHGLSAFSKHRPLKQA